MKTVLTKKLNLKVHCLWFVLACALLGAVVLSATFMVQDLASLADKQLQQNSVPLGGTPQT